MIVAFFHDVPLVKNNKEEYYSIGFPYKIWERYLSTFSSIIVSTRVKHLDFITDSAKEKLEKSSGANVEFKPISNYKKNSDLIFKRKEIVAQIRYSLKKADCAIIRLPSFIGQIACNEAVKMNKKFIIEVVGCARDSFWNHSNMGKFIAFPTYFAMKKTIRNSLYTTYVTSEFLQNRYPTKGKSMNCSDVSLGNFNSDVLNKRIKRIENKKSKLIIGTIGAVDIKYKGQESIIKALGKLKLEGNTDFEYQLVGGGKLSYLKEVAEKYDIKEQVKFLGVKTHKDVIDWLDNIDIYSQPSKTEGLPRGLIEAMSRGVLCIGSKVGGIPELLEKRYMFKKPPKNELEISAILNNITLDDLLEQANRNFKEAKRYEENLNEEKRQEFLFDFLLKINRNS